MEHNHVEHAFAIMNTILSALDVQPGMLISERRSSPQAMVQKEKDLARSVRKEMQLAEQRTGSMTASSTLGRDFEGRLKKLEEQVGKEIPQLKEAVRRRADFHFV